MAVDTVFKWTPQGQVGTTKSTTIFVGHERDGGHREGGDRQKNIRSAQIRLGTGAPWNLRTANDNLSL